MSEIIHPINIQISSSFEKMKKPVRILVNSKTIDHIKSNDIQIQINVGDVLCFKLDRLTGSNKIKITESSAISLTINKKLKILTILSALAFFVMSMISLSGPSSGFQPFLLPLILLTALATVLSFTLWKNKWIHIQKTE